LEKAALNKIVESLQKSKLADGKKLLVSNKVKPDILGGVLVEIGDKSIDLTVSSKLAKLNKLVTGKKKKNYYYALLMILYRICLNQVNVYFLVKEKMTTIIKM
jgi:vacuolar-type H+-ATPase subunit E/Vma4